MQFELRPLLSSDPLGDQYPQEAINCSSRALDTLIALTNEVEDARNACKLLTVVVLGIPR